MRSLYFEWTQNTGLQKIPLFQVIDPADMLDPDLCTPFNVVAVPATNEHDSSEDDCGLHSRTVGRLRHLDILEEVGLTSRG